MATIDEGATSMMVRFRLLGGLWGKDRRGVAALEFARIAARLEDDDASASLCEPCGDRSPAGARTDDDVLALERVHNAAISTPRRVRLARFSRCARTRLCAGYRDRRNYARWTGE